MNDSFSSESEENTKVKWLYQDPNTNEVLAYDTETAAAIEESYQKDEEQHTLLKKDENGVIEKKIIIAFSEKRQYDEAGKNAGRVLRDEHVGPRNARSRWGSGPSTTGCKEGDQNSSIPTFGRHHRNGEGGIDISVSEWLESMDPDPTMGPMHDRVMQIEYRLHKRRVQAMIKKHGLSHDEAFACVVFTLEVPELYEAMNRALRSGDIEKINFYRPFTERLYSGLQKLPKFTGVVYRALDKKEYVADYYVDKKCIFRQFTSCSMRLTERLLHRFGKDIGSLLALQVVEMPMLGLLTIYPEEEEVVLLPGWEGIVRGSLDDGARESLSRVQLFPADLINFTVLEIQDTTVPKATGFTVQTTKKEIQELIRKNKNDATLHKDLAILLSAYYKDHEAALEELHKAIAIDDKYAKAYCNLGVLYAFVFKKFDEAKNYFEEAVRLDPAFVVARVHLANVLFMRFQKPEDAKFHFKAALDHDKKYAPAHSDYGILLALHFKDYEGARSHLEQAVSINPNLANVQSNLGDILENHFQDYEGARHHYQLALETNPNYGALHYNLANLLHHRLDEYEEAKTHYMKAVELDPRLGSVHGCLGDLLLKKFKDFEGAKFHYEQMLNAETLFPYGMILDGDDIPTLASAHCALGMISEEHPHNVEEAKKHYEKAIELDPAYTLARDQLEKLVRRSSSC